QHRAGAPGPHLSLSPPLSRTSPRGAAHAQANRSAHPPTHAVSRSHRSPDWRSRMNLVELDHALRKLRLSGMAATLDARLRQAQPEKQPPIDLVSALVGDELVRREDRLIPRRLQQARFRDPERSLDNFDLDFNRKMNRALIHDLATGRFIQQREDA